MFPSLKKLAVLMMLLALIPLFSACGGDSLQAENDDDDGGAITEFALQDVDLKPVARVDAAMVPRDCEPGWDGCM
ncbi:MAG: hypothetical protein WC690_01035 [bacterium]